MSITAFINCSNEELIFSKHLAPVYECIFNIINFIGIAYSNCSWCFIYARGTLFDLKLQFSAVLTLSRFITVVRIFFSVPTINEYHPVLNLCSENPNSVAYNELFGLEWHTATLLGRV